MLVTAGPTYEAIDPVRGLTNLSSGKMGFAIARAAHEAGAKVTLVAGLVSLPTPRGVQRINVRSAHDMQQAVLGHVGGCQIFIANAAVADWRIEQSAAQKIKKDGSGLVPSLNLIENPDILAAVAASESARSGALFCVGFAAESHDYCTMPATNESARGCHYWLPTSVLLLLDKTTMPCFWSMHKVTPSCLAPINSVWRGNSSNIWHHAWGAPESPN